MNLEYFISKAGEQLNLEKACLTGAQDRPENPLRLPQPPSWGAFPHDGVENPDGPERPRMPGLVNEGQPIPVEAARTTEPLLEALKEKADSSMKALESAKTEWDRLLSPIKILNENPVIKGLRNDLYSKQVTLIEMSANLKYRGFNADPTTMFSEFTFNKRNSAELKKYHALEAEVLESKEQLQEVTSLLLKEHGMSLPSREQMEEAGKAVAMAKAQYEKDAKLYKSALKFSEVPKK